MLTDFEYNDFGHAKQTSKHHDDVLVERFRRLRYESLNRNYYNQKPESEKLKQYGNLHIKQEIQDFDKAKERMKQKMISCDNSTDNSVICTAMTQFKKDKE